MAGFNHNIKIGTKIYHVQTEQIERNHEIFAQSHIFLDGTILWSRKQKLTTDIESLSLLLKESHRVVLKYLKNAFQQKRNIDLFKIQSIIDLLIEYSSNIIRTVGIYTPDRGELVKKDLDKNYLPHFYQYYLKLQKIHPSHQLIKVFDKIYFHLDHSQRYVMMGRIPKTELIYTIIARQETEDFLNNILIPQFIKLISDLSQTNMFFGQNIPFSFHTA